MKRVFSKILMTLIALAIGMTPLLDTVPVKADSTISYLAWDKPQSWVATNSHGIWSTYNNAATPSSFLQNTDDKGIIGYQQYNTANIDDWTVYTDVLAFNMTSLTGATISAASLDLYWTDVASDGDSTPTFSIYRVKPAAENFIWASSDWRVPQTTTHQTVGGINYGVCSNSIAFSAVTLSTWSHITITDLTSLTPESNGFIYLGIESNYGVSDTRPNLTGTAENKVIRFSKSVASPSSCAQLVVNHSIVAPPTVTTDAASAVTNTGATLNGNLTSMGSQGFIPCQFEYGLTTGYGTVVGFHLQTNTGVFNDTITGLTSNTTYHYRAIAFDSVGAQVNGTDEEFTTSAPGTLPDTTAPTVTTYTDIVQSTTSARMVGTLDSLGSATNLTVGFNYGVAGGALGWYVDAYNSPFNETNGFSVIVGGLDPATVYAYQATATGDGTGVGEIKYFNTGTTPILGYPMVLTGNATVTELYPSLFEVTFNGNITSLGDNSDVRAKINYKRRGEANWYSGVYDAISENINATGDFSITTMIGLPRGTLLEYQAVVYNGTANWYGQDPHYGEGFIVPLTLIGDTYTPVPFNIILNPVSSATITSSSALLTADVANMPANTTARIRFSYGPGTYNNRTGAPQWTGAVDVLNNGTASIPIIGLSSATPYWYSAEGMIGLTQQYGSPESLAFTTLTSGGQTPGVTPTPTPTPGDGEIIPKPDGISTVAWHYMLIVISLLFGIVIPPFALPGSKALGRALAGAVAIVILAGFIAVGWIGVWEILLLSLTAGVVVAWVVTKALGLRY